MLDDVTNALDYKTESNVLNNILNYINENQITLLIASQRISTISKCDKVIVLDNGNIENIGTPDQLLNESKIYNQIFQLQKR
mgnify:FL=1